MSFVEFRHVANQNLQFEVSGKMYRIKSIQQRVAGKETKFEPIDLTALSKTEKDAFSDAAAKAAAIFPKIHGELAGAHSFTLTLRELGTKQPPLLHEITYQKSATSTPITIKLEGYSADALNTIHIRCQPLSRLIQQVSPKKQEKELIHPLDSAIRDAGSKGNKCAARALALALEPDSDTAAIDLGVANLLQAARHQIKNNPAFITPGTREQAELGAAADDYNKTAKEKTDLIPRGNDQVEMRDAYLEKMKKDGVMLDSVFFLAQPNPVIVLEPEKGSYRLNAVFHLDKCSSDQPVAVLEYCRDDPRAKPPIAPHYRAIIPTSDEHVEALKELFPRLADLFDMSFPIFQSIASDSDTD